MRPSDLVPPERALAQAEWVGTKIKQIAVLPPLHPSCKGDDQVQPLRTWKYNHLGLVFMGSSKPQRDEDRSRTPLRKGKGKGDPKGKGSGKKVKKSGKTIPNPEGEEEERTGRRFFPGPSSLPEAWKDRKKLLCQVLWRRNLRMPKQGLNGIPIVRRAWAVSDVPERITRVLDNQVGDPRLWDPSDEEFWSVCKPVESEDQALNKYRVLTPGEEVRVGYAHKHDHKN